MGVPTGHGFCVDAVVGYYWKRTPGRPPGSSRIPPGGHAFAGAGKSLWPSRPRISQGALCSRRPSAMESHWRDAPCARSVVVRKVSRKQVELSDWTGFLAAAAENHVSACAVQASRKYQAAGILP